MRILTAGDSWASMSEEGLIFFTPRPVLSFTKGGSAAQQWAFDHQGWRTALIDALEPGDVVWLSIGAIDEMTGVNPDWTAWYVSALVNTVLDQKPDTTIVHALYNREIPEDFAGCIPWDFAAERYVKLSFRFLDDEVHINPDDWMQLHLRPEHYAVRVEKAFQMLDFLRD